MIRSGNVKFLCNLQVEIPIVNRRHNYLLCIRYPIDKFMRINQVSLL